MEQHSKIHVGLDAHKDTIVIARADPGREPGRLVSQIAHDVSHLLKALGKIGAPAQLHIVYEAGPTGFGLQRELARRGYVCEVIAPSKTPRAPGVRVKNDRRDAIVLAQCSRAGDLHAVWIPDPSDEAIRDLSRAREDAVKACTRAKQHLAGFLLRNGLSFHGKKAWSKAYVKWLTSLQFEALAARIAFTEYQLAVEAAAQRVERLEQALADCVTGWRFEPVVRALQALRGIALITAVGLVAEIGDFSRFSHPRKLMGFLGLVPSEHSSGDRVLRGSITKTGNSHARRLLTEAAWNYRHRPRIGHDALDRQKNLSDAIRGHAWKSQQRLTKRFAALNSRGVQKNKICVAVARELTGFVWDVALKAMSEHQAKSARLDGVAT